MLKFPLQPNHHKVVDVSSNIDGNQQKQRKHSSSCLFPVKYDLTHSLKSYMQNNFAEPRVLKVRSAASVSASSLVVGCGNMDTILQFYSLQSTFRVQHQPADLPLITSRAFHDPPMIHPSAGSDLTWEAWPDSCLAYLPTKSSSSESEEEEKKNSSVFLSPVWSSEGIFRETNRELMENNKVVNKAEWGRGGGQLIWFFLDEFLQLWCFTKRNRRSVSLQGHNRAL